MDWQKILMPSTCQPEVLQCPHRHKRARFRRERNYSVRKQSMRSKKIIKNVQTQMPTVRADIADNVNVSGKSNTKRDFTPLWAHRKISAGPGVRKETILQLLPHGRVYVFISFFLYSLFSPSSPLSFNLWILNRHSERPFWWRTLIREVNRLKLSYQRLVHACTHTQNKRLRLLSESLKGKRTVKDCVCCV